MAKDPNAELIVRLTQLVIDGKIIAVDETSPISNNRFVFTHQGTEYATEWLQDDKPTLYINGNLAICDYVAQPLISELIDRFRKPIPKNPGAERWRAKQAAEQRKVVRETLKRLKSDK